jgi:hypothetical protein
VARNWKLKLIRPSESVKIAVNKGWADALKDLETWMQSDLVRAMVYGGLGIQGIAQTPFYKFVSSQDGLSQLGIEKTEPPKLLRAYLSTIKIIRKNNQVNIKFGDMALLKLATPHPASGTGHLQIESWLEWVFDKKKVASGFVPRNRMPVAIQKRIRVQSAPGGLMLSKGTFGSTGLWRFPTQLADFEVKWLRENVSTIEKLVQERAIVSLTKSFK